MSRLRLPTSRGLFAYNRDRDAESAAPSTEPNPNPSETSSSPFKKPLLSSRASLLSSTSMSSSRTSLLWYDDPDDRAAQEEEEEEEEEENRKSKQQLSRRQGRKIPVPFEDRICWKCGETSETVDTWGWDWKDPDREPDSHPKNYVCGKCIQKRSSSPKKSSRLKSLTPNKNRNRASKSSTSSSFSSSSNQSPSSSSSSSKRIRPAAPHRDSSAPRQRDRFCAGCGESGEYNAIRYLNKGATRYDPDPKARVCGRCYRTQRLIAYRKQEKGLTVTENIRNIIRRDKRKESERVKRGKGPNFTMRDNSL